LDDELDDEELELLELLLDDELDDELSSSSSSSSSLDDELEDDDELELDELDTGSGPSDITIYNSSPATNSVPGVIDCEIITPSGTQPEYCESNEATKPFDSAYC